MEVKSEGIVLKSRNLEFEEKGVFNPSCIDEGGRTGMFYRSSNMLDVSSVGYAEVLGPKVINRYDRPVVIPDQDFEIRGIEDARVTKLGGSYYMVYVAVDGLANARLAMAVSDDLKAWKKIGLVGPNITCSEALKLLDKRVMNSGYEYFLKYFTKTDGEKAYVFTKSGGVFPRRFGGKMAMLYRIHPGIQVIFADDVAVLKQDEYWRENLAQLGNFVVMNPKLGWEGEVIGMGSIPIETTIGWLMIYYGSNIVGEQRIYRVGAALLDLEDPRKEICRLAKPLFEPSESWEKVGNVANVVFPSGAIAKDGRLWIYYGAADKVIGAKSVDLGELLSELKKCKINI